MLEQEILAFSIEVIGMVSSFRGYHTCISIYLFVYLFIRQSRGLRLEDSCSCFVTLCLFSHCLSVNLLGMQQLHIAGLSSVANVYACLSF